MRNFHLTRIAVTPFLIVALVIQPASTCIASVECLERCSALQPHSGLGCSCCKSGEQAFGRCCRSDVSTSVKVESAETSCCSREHKDSTPANRSGDVDEPSATSIALVEGVRSICLCEQTSQPMGDSAPRRATIESRVTHCIATSDMDVGVWQRGRLHAAWRDATSMTPTHHFSQVVLCIWRL